MRADGLVVLNMVLSKVYMMCTNYRPLKVRDVKGSVSAKGGGHIEAKEKQSHSQAGTAEPLKVVAGSGFAACAESANALRI